LKGELFGTAARIRDNYRVVDGRRQTARPMESAGVEERRIAGLSDFIDLKKEGISCGEFYKRRR